MPQRDVAAKIRLCVSSLLDSDPLTVRRSQTTSSGDTRSGGSPLAFSGGIHIACVQRNHPIGDSATDFRGDRVRTWDRPLADESTESSDYHFGDLKDETIPDTWSYIGPRSGLGCGRGPRAACRRAEHQPRPG